MKKLTILGGGESGVGAAILGKKQGFEVFLSDKGNISEEYKNLLISNEIAFEENQHDEERILASDWVIKSPGIPKKAEIIQKIKQKGIRLSSEIEFGAEFTDAKIIAITGSNGKTTTTSLVYHILKNSGLNVGLGGNIGTSFAKQVAEENYDYFVLEISSFQLDDIQNFKPYISLLLNLSPDHLDQYNYNYEEYALAKFRIAENQDENDFFILNQDDEMTQNLLSTLRIDAQKFAFSLTEKVDAFQESGEIKVRDFSIKIKDLPIQGKHNVANVLSASLVAKTLNIDNESLKNALLSFQAVEHRLEQFAEINGVKYINDSKATNVNATYFALESMTAPTIWIVGGVDKGNDYTEIEELVAQKVKAVVCLGIDNQKIIDFFRDKVTQIYSTNNLHDCVKTAKSIAQEGDAVLLSPCCASFDLFQNYEDRGRKFKEEVLR